MQTILDSPEGLEADTLDPLGYTPSGLPHKLEALDSVIVAANDDRMAIWTDLNSSVDDAPRRHDHEINSNLRVAPSYSSRQPCGTPRSDRELAVSEI